MPVEKPTGLAARLATRPDAERIRLRLGPAFVEHRDDLWPQGEPNATPEWIRAHVDEILGLLELPLLLDGREVHRLPHRLHWLLWLVPDLEEAAIDGREYYLSENEAFGGRSCSDRASALRTALRDPICWKS